MQIYYTDQKSFYFNPHIERQFQGSIQTLSLSLSLSLTHTHTHTFIQHACTHTEKKLTLMFRF